MGRDEIKFNFTKYEANYSKFKEENGRPGLNRTNIPNWSIWNQMPNSGILTDKSNDRAFEIPVNLFDNNEISYEELQARISQPNIIAQKLQSLIARKKEQNDNSPLDSMGRLKVGWQFNRETGEFRKGPSIISGPAMGTIDDNGNFKPTNSPWINGGSSVREHNQGEPSVAKYIPSIDDYEPTFEIKDGKLEQTGVVKRNEIEYF